MCSRGNGRGSKCSSSSSTVPSVCRSRPTPTRPSPARISAAPTARPRCGWSSPTREDACLYFGFKEGVRREDLARASRASEANPDALPELLNKLPAAPGDAYLIPARVAHAIGAGCLILEVQEPTDFTIQPEAWCGDYHLSPYEMYLGLDEQTALECFDFTDLVGERAIAAGRKRPRTVVDAADLTVEALSATRTSPTSQSAATGCVAGSHLLRSRGPGGPDRRAGPRRWASNPPCSS